LLHHDGVPDRLLADVCDPDFRRAAGQSVGKPALEPSKVDRLEDLGALANM
jgi:hypothetical protein